MDHGPGTEPRANGPAGHGFLEKFLDRPPRADDVDRSSAGILVVSLQRDSHRAVNRGHDVQRNRWPFLDTYPVLFTGADDRAAGQAAAAEHHRKAA